MIVNYSKLNTLETPILTLCNPGCTYDEETRRLSNVVGLLSNTEAEEIIYNFNSQSELNFRINAVPDFLDGTSLSKEEKSYALKMYRSVENRRLIFIDEIGFFVIKSVKERFEGGIRYKDVSAESVEEELAQRMVPYIEVEAASNTKTYVFTTDADETTSEDSQLNKPIGILDTVINSIPLWKKGYISESIAKRMRTIEEVDSSKNCLGFLIDDLQEIYECVFEFDILRREINVYDQENYARDFKSAKGKNMRTNIIISNEDLINSINIDYDSDNIYTAIRPHGDNESIFISPVNPTGDNVIYNFQYYLDWMPDELSSKVKNWQDEIEGHLNAEDESSYYNKSLAYYTAIKDYSNKQNALESLEIKIDKYVRCKNNVCTEKDANLVSEYLGGYEDTNIDTSADIEVILSALDEAIGNLVADRNTAKTNVDNAAIALENARAAVTEINGQLDIDNYFDPAEILELSNFVFEGKYTDNYVTYTDTMDDVEKFKQMKLLYDRANKQLKKSSVPTKKFSIDVESFVFSKDFKAWSEQLYTGCVIAVECDPGNIEDLVLLSISVDYDDKHMSLTFGNSYNKYDMKSLFQDVLGKISKTANTLSYVKDLTVPLKNNGFNRMEESIKATRNLTKDSVISSDNQEVVIDGSGYLGRRRDDSTVDGYDKSQIKITNKNIAFTSDSWDTSGLVFGEIQVPGDTPDTTKIVRGVNAEYIIGEMIVGAGLKIKDDNNQDVIVAGADGVTIFGKGKDDFGSVDSVVTPANKYKFNDDGMFISGGNNGISNRVYNEGMKVYREDAADEENKTAVLTADYNGVNALNLTSRQYLIIGDYARFENYEVDEKKRTACYYIADLGGVE